MKALTEDEVFGMLNKHAAGALAHGATENLREVGLREDLKALAKSHEALRNQAKRLEGFIDLGYELMAKAKRTT